MRLLDVTGSPFAGILSLRDSPKIPLPVFAGLGFCLCQRILSRIGSDVTGSVRGRSRLIHFSVGDLSQFVVRALSLSVHLCTP